MAKVQCQSHIVDFSQILRLQLEFDLCFFFLELYFPMYCSFGNNILVCNNSNHRLWIKSILLYSLKLLSFFYQSAQTSRILIEKFTSESKESVITLNQHRRSSRVSIIFSLTYGLVSLSSCSLDIISSDFRSNFLIFPHSGKCLSALTRMFAEDIFPLFQICCLYDTQNMLFTNQ